HSEGASAHFPPGYSAMLATTSLLTRRDVRHGAPRLLSAALFGILGATSIMLLQAVHANFSIQTLSLLTLLSFRPLLNHASLATSELPFLTALALAILFFIWWSDNKRLLFFILSAVCCGVMCVTRYVGIVWPIAFFLTCLFFQRESNVRQRFISSLAFITFAYIPLVLWLLGWKLFGAGESARSIAWHPVSLELVQHGLFELSSSVCITAIPKSVIFIAILLVGCVITKRLFPPPEQTSPSQPNTSLLLLFLLGLSTFGYIVFLMLSISVLDRATPLDGRILLPATWSLMMILLVLLHLLMRQNRNIVAGYMVVLFAFFWIRFLFDATPLLADLNREGIDLARPEILYNKTLDFIRMEVSQEKVVYSNTPWTVSLVSKRNVRYMPSKTAYTSGVVNQNYEKELNAIAEQVKKGEALIVLDALYSDAVYDPPTQQEIEGIGLIAEPIKSTERFRVYGQP
ncbi:MAG: hypothetical protein JNK90_07525, partial [Planctomycetaceae bacterium]|nr:hypothetical protein [Planctomycetaceae bacterium]